MKVENMFLIPELEKFAPKKKASWLGKKKKKEEKKSAFQ